MPWPIVQRKWPRWPANSNHGGWESRQRRPRGSDAPAQEPRQQAENLCGARNHVEKLEADEDTRGPVYLWRFTWYPTREICLCEGSPTFAASVRPDDIRVGAATHVHPLSRKRKIAQVRPDSADDCIEWRPRSTEEHHWRMFVDRRQIRGVFLCSRTERSPETVQHAPVSISANPFPATHVPPDFGGETAVVLCACGWENFSGQDTR